MHALDPQIMETLHYLQKLHQKLGYRNLKIDAGDPIPIDSLIKLNKIKILIDPSDFHMHVWAIKEIRILIIP